MLKNFKTLSLLVVLFLAYIAVEVILSCRAKPPATVRTFDGYLQWQTRHRRINVRDTPGQAFVLMYGPNAGIVPSGPPVYVFDASGQMVGWTTDSGDDPRFQGKWFGNPRPREATLAEVQARYAGTRTSN